MPKRLTKTGNSLAFILEKPILEATGIDATTPLEVSTDGDVIVISPIRNAKRRKAIQKAMAEIDDMYAGVFRRLAE
ncbi:MAG: AbrB/MazE/SpoVT family DNA-binding domain-containing protein [Thermoanaerobaculia bacterium]